MGMKRTAEFRADVVRIALTSGLSRKQVALDLGIGLSTLNGPVYQCSSPGGGNGPNNTGQRSLVHRADRETLREIGSSPLRRCTKMDGKHGCKLWDVKLARGHTFVCCPSLRGSMVIDAGAHRCEFAYMMASKYGARVIALEPNSELPVDHSHPEMRLLRAALADADGQGSLFIDDNLEASSIIHDGASDTDGPAGRPCEFRSIRSLIAEFNIDRIGLLKLDIEGAEFGVIESIDDDIALLIDQITIEFHPAAPTSAESSPIENAILHLESLGFQMFRSSHTGYGDILFLNSRSFEIPGKQFGAALPYYRKALEICFER